MIYRLVFLLLAFFVLLISITTDSWAKSKNKTISAVSDARDGESVTQQSGLAIAAIVGSQAISSFDVINRMKFIIATTGMSNTPEMLANIRPQVINALINESLQMQEAERNNISVDDQEVAQAIRNIEAQRGIPQGGIAQMLAANHIPEKIFNEQIRAQLAWSKLLAKIVRPRIRISDNEVALANGHLPSVATENKVREDVIKEMEIAVISLPVDRPQREAETKKLSHKLYEELRKGVRFEEVARQFSANGDTKSFWIRPQQLEPNIAKILRSTKQGTITAPIRTHDGFSIIKLLNIKTNKPTVKNNSKPEIKKTETEVTLKEILLKLKADANEKDVDILLQIGEEISKNPGSCEEKGIANIAGLENFDISVNVRKAVTSELPPALRNLTETMKIGDMSVPFAGAEGVRMYMLCGTQEVANIPASNSDKIRESIFRQKFELEAQKYLRNLQRGTFIEIRG